MEILLQSNSTTTQSFNSISIADAEIYEDFSDELQMLHKVALQPDASVVNSLLERIRALTN